MRRETLSQLLQELSARRPVVLATDLGSGEQWLVDPFGDGAGLAPALHESAREAAEQDRSRAVELSSGPTFLRVFSPPVRVIVVGAVHLAQSLSRMVQLAGYDVLVVDPRGSFASEERFPGIRLSREWPEEALTRAGLDRRTAVVTLTHDPKLDDPALAAALRSLAFYVGALGSRKTQAARAERLRGMGFSDAELARIHGPVGLSIGAVSPGEIAVSILAELVGSLRRPSTPPPAGG